MGVSAGGLEALSSILPVLPAGLPVPVAVVQHLLPTADDYLPRSLNEKCEVTVKQAEEKERLEPGSVYIAPPNYHLLIETDRTFSLTVDPPVNYARPSIDVLFETAAEVYQNGLIGVVLTGANNDGSNGLRRIEKCGGFALVQDPATARARAMPEAALAVVAAALVAPLSDIGGRLCELCFSADV